MERCFGHVKPGMGGVAIAAHLHQAVISVAAVGPWLGRVKGLAGLAETAAGKWRNLASGHRAVHSRWGMSCIGCYAVF
ncbi:hypothetical protein A9978_05030 [Pseudomonas sp. UMC65]|nr:hypothetical protein [Pseudomonas sp. UMC65]MBB1621934.1 hypothetical protein [Pseudomonas sp. UME65]